LSAWSVEEEEKNSTLVFFFNLMKFYLG